jgi:tRNA G46 methylase TrmB
MNLSDYFKHKESFFKLRVLRSTLSREQLNLFFSEPQFYIPPPDLHFFGHSQILDDLLGFEIKSVESKLVEIAKSKSSDTDNKTWGPVVHGVQSWLGLDQQVLQTPYNQLAEILRITEVKPGEKVIDLGAGYGRLGLIMSYLYPQTEFLGIEFVEERIQEARRVFSRFNKQHISLLKQNLREVEALPLGDIYYIYEFGTKEDLARIVEKLKTISLQRQIKVVARGKFANQTILLNHPWLKHSHQFDAGTHLFLSA